MPKPTCHTLDDKQLLDLLQQGDEFALAEIYERYWSKLYLQAYNVIRDRQIAEDIVQEVIVQLWIRRSVAEIASLKAYLYTCIKYQTFKALPTARAKTNLMQEHIAFVDDTGDLVMAKDFQQQLDIAVSKLPAKCRDVFNLSRKDHLSTKEVALRLGISPKTVENQLTIALRRIRFVLDSALVFAILIGYTG
jgi:RNA polymerase sigma-70 factor (family 1)